MEETLTIEGIDAETFERLNLEAGRRGVAVSVFAKMLLTESVGPQGALHHDLDALVGTWSEQDAAEFSANTAAMRGIDGELWR